MTYLSPRLVPSVYVPLRRLRTWPRKQQRRYRRLYDQIVFSNLYSEAVVMLNGVLSPGISSVVWKPTRFEGDTLHGEMTITTTRNGRIEEIVLTEPYRGQSDVEIEVSE
jgi:hypothetical protein